MGNHLEIKTAEPAPDYEAIARDLFGVVRSLTWEFDSLDGEGSRMESERTPELVGLVRRHAQGAREHGSEALHKYADALGQTVTMPWEEEAPSWPL